MLKPVKSGLYIPVESEGLGGLQVSLAHWNQDEAWGGFGGPHCMVKGGYSSLMEPLAATLNIQRGVAVSQISYNNHGVKVTSSSGELTCFIMTVKQDCVAIASCCQYL